ncbi:hypothetical protein AB6N23_18490, partial [Cellulomonas sp. 179-A 9B4 NHS]
MSAAAAAVTVGTVAVVAAAVVGAVQLIGGPTGDVVATPGPSPTVSGSTLEPTATAGPAPTVEPTPTVSPTDLPTPTPSLEPDPDPTPRDDGTVLAGPPPGAGEPEPAPSAGPPPEPQPDPGPGPDPGPDPPPAPDVVVEPPEGGIVLAAGGVGQELGLTVRNDGDRAAVDLRAEITLPPGVEVQGIAGIIAVGAGLAPLVTDGWVCTPVAQHQATCALPELPAHTAVRLVLRVSNGEEFVPTAGLSVGVRI